MISKWRSIKPVEINQYDITMVIHCDITMGNDVAMDSYCEITMGNYVARDIHCDVTMSNDVALCTYHGIIMHSDVAMNLLYYVFSALCLIMILTSSCLISLGWRTHSMFLGRHLLFHNDVPKYLNQIYSLLLLVIEYSRVNSFLPIFLFFQMYIADLI